MVSRWSADHLPTTFLRCSLFTIIAKVQLCEYKTQNVEVFLAVYHAWLSSGPPEFFTFVLWNLLIISVSIFTVIFWLQHLFRNKKIFEDSMEMEQLKSHLRAGWHKHQLFFRHSSHKCTFVLGNQSCCFADAAITVLIPVLLKLPTKLTQNHKNWLFPDNANKFGTLPKSGKEGRSFPYTVVVQTI